MPIEQNKLVINITLATKCWENSTSLLLSHATGKMWGLQMDRGLYLRLEAARPPRSGSVPGQKGQDTEAASGACSFPGQYPQRSGRRQSPNVMGELGGEVS